MRPRGVWTLLEAIGMRNSSNSDSRYPPAFLSYLPVGYFEKRKIQPKPHTHDRTHHPTPTNVFFLSGSVFLFSHSTYFPDVSGLNSFSILAPAPNLNAARFCSNSWALICFRFWERPKFNAAQMCFPFRRPYLLSDILDGHQLHKQMVVSILHNVEF